MTQFPTVTESLLSRLERIHQLMDDLLDASTIEYVRGRARLAMQQRKDAFAALGQYDGRWGPSDDKQQGLQRRLLEEWRPWIEQTTLLFSENTSARRAEIETAARPVAGWIERSGYADRIPPTTKDAKAVFREMTKSLSDALRSTGLGSGMVLGVPDTNLLLRSPDVANYAEVLGTDRYTVTLLPGVLGELDQAKVNHRNEAVREKARKFSARIKGWRNQGSLAEGVRVQGNVFVRVEGREPDFEKTLSWLDPDVVDDRIIASVLELQRRNPSAPVVLLTGDTLMLAKADAASIPTTDTPDPEP